MVFASGEGRNLRRRPFAKDDPERVAHYALSNPIFIDVDGEGFQPHSPVDDKVYTRMDAAGMVEPGGTVDVRLFLANLADVPATDRFSVKIIESASASPPTELDQINPLGALGELIDKPKPPPAVEVVGGNSFEYTLAPGEQKMMPFKLKLRDGQRLPATITLRVERSSHGVGRRPVGLLLRAGNEARFLENQGVVAQRQAWWLPSLNPYAPKEVDAETPTPDIDDAQSDGADDVD